MKKAIFLISLFLLTGLASYAGDVISAGKAREIAAQFFCAGQSGRRTAASADLQFVKSSPKDAWFEIIKDQIDSDHPVLYGGNSSAGGHQFVVDGYNSSKEVHINFGWGGADNGYYLLTDMGGFSSSQDIIINIKKDEGVSPEPYEMISLYGGGIEMNGTYTAGLPFKVSTSEGGEITIEVSTNLECEVAVTGNWLSYTPTKALAQKGFTFTATAPVFGSKIDQGHIDWGDGKTSTYSTGVKHEYTDSETSHTVTAHVVKNTVAGISGISGVTAIDFTKL